MRSMLPARSAAVLMTASLFITAAGCKDKMCPAGSLPDAWKPYEDLVPQNAVLCGTTRGPDDPGAKTAKPEKIFVYFKDKSAHEAWLQTVTDFEGKGWERFGPGGSSQGEFNADAPPLLWFRKGGDSIHVMINKNDFGVQGLFEIESKGGKKP